MLGRHLTTDGEREGSNGLRGFADHSLDNASCNEQRLYDSVGRPTSLWARLSAVGNQNRLHSGGDRGPNAGLGVFEHYAIGRATIKTRGSHQEHLGVGFASADLVTADDDVEMTQHAGLTKLIRRKLCRC
jgi:hypothetical protein